MKIKHINSNILGTLNRLCHARLSGSPYISRLNSYKKWLPFGILASLLIATPVLAYSYSAQLQVVESNGTAHVKLPIIADVDNTYLADNGFIDADGLDTRVELGGTAIPHMLADDKVLFVNTIGANTTSNFYYTMGNTPLSSFDIITGVGGYVTTADDASLEPGADFTIDYSGYVDTSAANVGEVIAEKDGAVTLYVSSAGNIAGGFDGEDIVSIIPMTPSVNVAPAALTAWTDVDCTALGVPDSASGVVIHIVNTNAAYQEYGLRKNGSADDRHSDFMNSSHNWAMIGTDANGIFEAYIESASIEMYVTGYTNPATVIFNTNADNISLGATGAWTDIDCSAICPDAKAILVEVTNLGATALVSGLRPNGSAATSTLADIGIKVHDFYLVGCDTNQIIEGYIESVAVDFYVIGYITDGITMFTDPVDKSLGGTGAWTDIDCSASTDSSTSGLIFSITNVSAAYGFRKNGSAEDINRNGHNFASFMSIVECDGNQVVEGKIANLAQDFWLWGYFGKAKTLVTSACASGEHDIRLDYDGTNLDLFIDDMGVAVDTEAIVTTVSDNGNDWIIGSNATPYMDYLTITTAVGGVSEKLRYEPIDIISGTTLPDETGTFDGVITWGSNPAGIALTVGSMVSSSAPAPSTAGTALPGQDALPPITQPSGFITTPISTNTTHVLYPFMHTLSDLSGIPIGLVWLLVLAVPVTVCVLIATLKYLHNQFLVLAFVGTTMLIFWQMGIYPFWIPLIFGFVAAGIVIYERKTSM